MHASVHKAYQFVAASQKPSLSLHHFDRTGMKVTYRPGIIQHQKHSQRQCSAIMGKNTFLLVDLPEDIIFEILGHLPVEDILRSRHVCRRLFQASYQRSLWISAYERSNLLLPEGPLPSQSTFELESLLVRAAKIDWHWTSPQPASFTRRRFPRALPTYDFDANIISGRYLQLAQRDGISWYDLDSSDIGMPILTYPCPTVVPTVGFLNYQANANGEGPGTFWVSFLCLAPTRIVVLKVILDTKVGHNAKVHAEIPAENVARIQMNFDWLVLISEFVSSDTPIELFHIPSQSTIYAPIHEKAQNLSDLNSMRYAITPDFLFITFSLRNETLFDTYPLPKHIGALSSFHLARTHSGVYPHAISNIQVVETPLSNSVSEDVKVSFLALVYLHRAPMSWTSKIALHLLDATMPPDGYLTFTTQSQRTLNVGIATTALSFSAHSGSCLALTHSTPGPMLLAHHIRRQDSGCVMGVKALKLPDGLQSREMLAFDGFRGRICLINGWTSIEVLDCA